MAVPGKRGYTALQSTPIPAFVGDAVVPTRGRSRRNLFHGGRVFSAKAASESENEWRSLRVSSLELSLPLTLVTGQSFRWRATGPSQFTGVVGSHLVSLKESAGDVSFLLHTPDRYGSAEADLRDYLNLETSLEKLYAEFTLADVRFAAVAPYLAGARLLRQSPVECVYQFICSSNNHIQRISGMVEYLASRGALLGTVHGVKFHAFPSLDELTFLTEDHLRRAGFGYRSLPHSL